MAEIDMTKPQPCTKYRDATQIEWIAKLDEETDEVIQDTMIISQLEQTNNKAPCEAMNEVLQDARKRRALEITDVITVCVSWLDADGWKRSGLRNAPVRKWKIRFRKTRNGS